LYQIGEDSCVRLLVDFIVEVAGLRFGPERRREILHKQFRLRPTTWLQPAYVSADKHAICNEAADARQNDAEPACTRRRSVDSLRRSRALGEKALTEVSRLPVDIDEERQQQRELHVVGCGDNEQTDESDQECVSQLNCERARRDCPRYQQREL
jgi:hypothetical protein